ncbi:hypothetical protein REPUB_Repub20aG0067100 [Reevesia pubescens]
MESSSASNELQKLVEAIKISEVVEGRAELIAKLADLHLSGESDVKYLVGSLICMLNKTVLHVAAKYLDSDISSCLLQFLLLGTKASIWCGKHLKMTVMSTEESPEEEHCSLFYQLLLEFLSFSASIFSSMSRSSVLIDKASMVVVEKFILEQLNLTKDTISEIKNVDSTGAEILKAAQSVIDALLRLCKEYSQEMNSEFSGGEPQNNENGMNCEQACITNHITNITTVTVEKLFELGILAANGGGSFVSILNVSWKGVVTLLQLAKGKLPVKVNVADIIVTLISLVNGSLKCAAEAWSSSLKDTVSVTEARRIFVPIKFYLINAVKISSLYPCQAYMVYRDLVLCSLMISAFKLLVSHEKLMKNVSEVMAELLEKTSLDLLSSLLNSTDVKQELKYELLDWLFFDDCLSDAVHENPVSKCSMTSMEEIFSVSCEAMPRSRVLLFGQVALFSSFLRFAFDLEEVVKLQMARKLGWFMNIIIDEEVYSFILVSQIPVLKMVRSVCTLLTFSTTSVVDCVYGNVVGDDRSQLSSVLYAALLLEGFPLSLLSENMRSIAKENMIIDYFGFIDGFDDKSLTASSSGFGFPVFALSASLQSLQVTITDIDMKTLKFLVAIVCGYRNSVDNLKKEVFCKRLSRTLGIISNLSHLYASEEMEDVILELHNLFVSGPAASDTLLYLCKPGLALFMAGLSNMGMSESDNCAKSTVMWELYHMLLRERHWAFVHLSIAAFGYFAARTKLQSVMEICAPRCSSFI